MKHYIKLLFLLLVFFGNSAVTLADPFITQAGYVCAEDGDKEEETRPTDEEEEPDCE